MGKILTLVLGSGFLVLGCASNEKPTQEQLEAHQQDVAAWFDHRVGELKSHNGWLNLAGLFWLKDGINSFGSAESNDVVFPADKIAPKAGYFIVKGQSVTLMPAPGGEISIYGTPVETETVIFHPDSARAIKLLQGSITQHGSLEWYIIRRENKMGIRLRDLESEGVKNFKGIERYPVDYSWRIPTRFEPATPGTMIDITNVLGQTFPDVLAGHYVFEVEGKEYKLEATGDGEELFVVFGDDTNGKETYGAGKFLYVNRPDSTGRAYIDFNKSYNPPCAFTDFATCPLPRKENVLPVAITAGEKSFELHPK